MKKRGRPKVKKTEFKKPFPMRFSEAELKVFKHAAGDKPVREWIRETLWDASGLTAHAQGAVRAMINEATGYKLTGQHVSSVPPSSGPSQQPTAPPSR